MDVKLDLKHINEFIKDQKIERLHLEEYLGGGSYGEVWSARYHDIPVVVKVEILQEGEHPTLYQEYLNYKALSQVIDVTQKNWKLYASRFNGVPKCLLYCSSYGRNSDKNIYRVHTIADSQYTNDKTTDNMDCRDV